MDKVLKHYIFVTLLVSCQAFSLSFRSSNFDIEYDDNVSPALIKKFAEQVEKDRAVVLSYLNQSKRYEGTPIQGRLEVYISKTKRTPYQNLNTVYFPEKRLLEAYAKAPEGSFGNLSIIHELTHVYAVSRFRKEKIDGYENRFYDDGFAVFLQHRFGREPGYPNSGLDLYIAVAKQAKSFGGLISLDKAEEHRHASRTGLGRRLAYTQEGAFTQFLIERFGLDAYLDIYAGADIEATTGYSFAELEQQWLKMISVFMQE